ncbi:unknown protein [Oryza sativa Japonica Group]|uniref:Uncharacterized protein B1129G05.13 n=1 Tax=Oryza sativa subsp. japonica TaxID=39947 RepID=Q657B7_ORYSJ|nr:unknown protein [Oryza sativa Japonica Group]
MRVVLLFRRRRCQGSVGANGRATDWSQLDAGSAIRAGRGDTGGDHRRLSPHRRLAPSSTSPPPEQTAGNRAAARKSAVGPSFSLEGAGRCPRPRPVGGGDGAVASASASGRRARRAEATGCGTAGRRRLGAERGRRRRRQIWRPSPNPAVRPPPGTTAAPKEAGKGDAGGGKGGAAATALPRVASPIRAGGEWSAPGRRGNRQAGAASRWTGDGSGGSLPSWSRRCRRRLSSVGVGFGNAAAARPSWSSPVPGWIWPSAARFVASTPDGSWSVGRLRVDGKRGGGSLAASLLLGRGLLPVVGLVVVDGQRCADVEMAGRRLVLA